ncbi:MAG: regulatory protein RecX [Acidithiobacillus sp.]|uniref:regulatory protein RecX n=1 Tax=Acidithiobacillus sp. TaxID=1872118 RepID=UPI003D07C8DC
MSAAAPDPRAHALRLLARREYSRAELRDRLSRAGYDAGQIDGTLDALAREGCQDDARYAEMLGRTRLRQGHGPLRLRRDLARAGVELEQPSIPQADWLIQARAALHKRFGDAPAENRREWERRARFLAGRGFTSELIRRALDGDPDAY